MSSDYLTDADCAELVGLATSARRTIAKQQEDLAGAQLLLGDEARVMVAYANEKLRQQRADIVAYLIRRARADDKYGFVALAAARGVERGEDVA